MTAAPLEVFFAEMAALLAGERSAAACEAVLGPSPSGTTRFGVYATLVDRQQRAAVDGFFRAAMVAAASWDQARCDALRAGYLRAHPPGHWSPPEVAAGFADYLEVEGAPADVVELADFARTRHEVLRAPLGDGIDGLAVRHYSHAVREFVQAVEHDHLAHGRPARSPSTLLFGRHRERADLVLLTPSLETLVALQVIADGAWSDELPAVDRGEVGRAAQRLDAAGLLSPVAVAAVTRWA